MIILPHDQHNANSQLDSLFREMREKARTGGSRWTVAVSSGPAGYALQFVWTPAPKPESLRSDSPAIETPAPAEKA